MSQNVFHVIIFLGVLSFSQGVVAQSLSDVTFFSLISEETKALQSTAPAVKQDKNAIQQSTSLLYGVYRNLISSQDGSTCRFYPTCSAYCKQAVIQNGPILGMIQTFDRLTRCNGLTPQKYQIDMQRRKLVDHVH